MPVVRRAVIRFACTALAACLALSPVVAAFAEGAKARVAFVGDSLAQNYWAGVRRLVARDACLKSHLDLANYGKPATGLSNIDHFNWPPEARRVTLAYRPAVTVMTIGLNDRQGISETGKKPIMRATPEWTERYRQQIKDLLDGANATKPIILFVGLPVMRDAYFDTDMKAKNILYAEGVQRLAQPNVRYVEPWRLNPTGPEPYAAAITLNEKRVQLRTSDGVHFTGAGEDMLARYLMPKIVAALAEVGLKVDHCPEKEKAAEDDDEEDDGKPKLRR